MEICLNSDVDGSDWFGRVCSGGGGGWYALGVNGLSGVEADGGPSSVVQPPLLKPDADVIGRARSGAAGYDSKGFEGDGEGGFCKSETAVHPGFLNPPPEEELLTVDQPPVVKPDFFSGGAGPGSMAGVGVETSGVTVLSFTPAALAAFRSSLSSLFLSFSLRFSTASWELTMARSFDFISLNRILW